MLENDLWTQFASGPPRASGSCLGASGLRIFSRFELQYLKRVETRRLEVLKCPAAELTACYISS